jgi:4-hydroxy-tetrahydrodipicolinate synthase
MKNLIGAWPTMVTPFDESLQIDLGIFREMVAWYLDQPIGGLYANCLSSEMYHLTPQERIMLAREAVRAVGGKKPVAATGNLGEDLEEHILHCCHIAETGVDVVMLVVPAFLESESEMEGYFHTMAERVDAPLGLYECPTPRSFHLNPALVGRLAQTGRFVAYKETSCDLDRIKAHLAAVAGTPLAVLQANTPYMLAAVRAGTPGSMTIAAIWLPDLVAEVIVKAQADDPAADRLHARLCAMKLAQRAVHPLGSKYLLSKRGVPIAPIGRLTPQRLRPETLLALDYATRDWLDGSGRLV